MLFRFKSHLYGIEISVYWNGVTADYLCLNRTFMELKLSRHKALACLALV